MEKPIHPTTEPINDLRPFRHGMEGTHSICNKHIVESDTCCICLKKTDCDWDAPFPLSTTEPKMLVGVDGKLHPDPAFDTPPVEGEWD